MPSKMYIDKAAIDLYGITKTTAIKQNVCIKCKSKPFFYSQAGKDEYQLSGLGETCFDSTFDNSGKTCIDSYVALS